MACRTRSCLTRHGFLAQCTRHSRINGRARMPTQRQTVFPHVLVGGSAITAAVMSMEAGAVQLSSGLSAAAVALVASGVSLTALGVPACWRREHLSINSASWRWLVASGVLAGSSPMFAFYAIPVLGLSEVACGEPLRGVTFHGYRRDGGICDSVGYGAGALRWVSFCSRSSDCLSGDGCRSAHGLDGIVADRGASAGTFFGRGQRPVP